MSTQRATIRAMNLTRRRTTGAGAAALSLVMLLAGCGSHDHPQASTDSAATIAATEPSPTTLAPTSVAGTSPQSPETSSVGPSPSSEPQHDAPVGLQYYSRVGGAGDAIGVQVDARTGRDTMWSTFGGACVADCAASIDVVGETASDVPTAVWATRSIEQRADGTTVWAVTDVLPMLAGIEAFGSYDCAVGVPLVDASGSIVKLLTVDLESGKFAEMPIDDGQCSVVDD